jgi:hypothetical protein
MTQQREDQKHIYPPSDSVTDPHLACLLRLNEKLDKVINGEHHASTPETSESSLP